MIRCFPLPVALGALHQWPAISKQADAAHVRRVQGRAQFPLDRPASDAGTRYNSDATDKYAAAIIIELIGLRRWQWSEGNAVNARGASLILSYSDQGESKKYGWSGMVTSMTTCPSA